MDATELAYAGAARQAALIAAGEVSPSEVVQATLDRIGRLDPHLNAFRVVLAERALLEARQAEGRRGAGARRPLLGVPVAIKDDVDVAGEVTAFGSLAEDRPAAADAEVVRRLRAAGAIVIGKTHLPELAHLPSTDGAAFGVTRNPWDLSRTPGGSSGGSAAAAAAGLCGVALGSDGAGSIRGPASLCGLFGLKPTRDRVPLAPHDGAWRGMSVNGPLARTTADAAAFLAATAQDGAALAGAADADPPRLRVAVSTKLVPGAIAPIAPDSRAAVGRAAGRLRDLGHEVVERDPDLPASLMASMTARILRGIADDAAQVAHPERLSPRIKALAAMGRRLPVERALAAEAGQAERIGALWRDVDVLLTPSAVRPADPVGFYEGFGAARYLWAAPQRIPFFGPFNLTGQPAASVPAGEDEHGLPVGVQLVARRGEDATLLALGGQLERAHPWAHKRPPL
jgi:amidase